MKTGSVEVGDRVFTATDGVTTYTAWVSMAESFELEHWRQGHRVPRHHTLNVIGVRKHPDYPAMGNIIAVECEGYTYMVTEVCLECTSDRMTVDEDNFTL